jgi:hypothetical protein
MVGNSLVLKEQASRQGVPHDMLHLFKKLG